MSSGKGRCRRGLAMAVVAWCSPLVARAEPGQERRIDYQAPPECPTVTDFTQRLLVRTSARPARADSTLVVRVTQRDHGARAHGELSVHYVDGSEATRVVDGDTCESVVDALALMSAMALDPAAIPAAAPPIPVPDDAAPSVPLDARVGWHVAAGAGGGATFVLAPVAAPDVTAFVDVARGGTGLFAPALRIGFEYASSGTAGVTGGRMQMSRSLGVVEACPLAVRAGALRLAPCARIEAGGVDASGVDVTPSRSALRPWVAPGLLGRVRYVLPPRFFVELSGGVVAPLVRDHFYFDPSDTTAFRPPVVSGFAGGALGITIR